MVSVALRALVVLLLLVGIAIDFALQMPTGRRSEGAGPGTHASVSDVAFSDGSTRRLLYIAPVAEVADLAAAYAPRALVILLLGTLVVAGLLIARRPAQRLRASAGRIVSLPAFRARRRVSVAATRPTPLIGIVSSEEPSLDALEALYGRVLDALDALRTLDKAMPRRESQRMAVGEKTIGVLLDLLEYLTDNRSRFPALQLEIWEMETDLGDAAVGLARPEGISTEHLMRRLHELRGQLEGELHDRLTLVAAAA